MKGDNIYEKRKQGSRGHATQTTMYQGGIAMLKIYDPDIDDISSLDNVVRDVEEAFIGIALKRDDVVDNLLREIDKAKYYSEDRFEDRFGVPVYITELSTGCKAALLVHFYPDKVIDLIECGVNARDAILRNCLSGNVIYYDMGITVCNYGCEDKQVSIDVHGKLINRISDFNRYYGSYEYYR
jgi:hypothetical protein